MVLASHPFYVEPKVEDPKLANLAVGGAVLVRVKIISIQHNGIVAEGKAHDGRSFPWAWFPTSEIYGPEQR